MSTSTLTLRRSGSSSLGQRQRLAAPATEPRLASTLAGVLGALARAYRVRRDTRRLSAFSDHMLRDVGLGRGGIGRAVRVGRDWR